MYVLIDIIGTTRRAHEPPCNADFWLAAQQGLLPQVKVAAPSSNRAGRAVVVGQSFGGLPALYAELHWPKHLDCVLSQPGLYWWPYRGGRQESTLLKQLGTGGVSAGGLRTVLETSVHGLVIIQASQALYAQLHPLEESIFWRQVDGRHDALCWRDGLMQGLTDFW